MLIVVTFVSSLVHLYSISYMSEDPHSPRFMCYLSIFTFFMLMSVTGDNFIQLFLGWEGLALGIMGRFTIFQTVDFSTIFARASAFSEPHHYFIFCNMRFHAITVICILLFIGAVGKSAQIGLHTRLPDAMEGFRISEGSHVPIRYIITISLYAGIVDRMRVPIGKIS